MLPNVIAPRIETKTPKKLLKRKNREFEPLKLIYYSS